MNEDFPIKGWKWIFYVYGWIIGPLIPLVWIFNMLGLGKTSIGKWVFFFLYSFFYKMEWLRIALFILFLVVVTFLYYKKDKETETRFFNPDFHKRIFWWGLIIISTRVFLWVVLVLLWYI